MLMRGLNKLKFYINLYYDNYFNILFNIFLNIDDLGNLGKSFSIFKGNLGKGLFLFSTTSSYVGRLSSYVGGFP
jgi:hypothetical protein